MQPGLPVPAFLLLKYHVEHMGLSIMKHGIAYYEIGITQYFLIKTFNPFISEHTEAIDRNRKKALYERYHVREYWIVHPDKRQVEQYVLEEGTFKHQASAGASQKLASKAISGFRLQLEEVFES